MMLVIVKQNFVQIGRMDEPTDCSSYILKLKRGKQVPDTLPERHGNRTPGLPFSRERKHGFSTEPAPVSAYVGSS